jgi:hypothetical protein
LNGAARSDVGAADRSNLISGDSAKISSTDATKKLTFSGLPPGTTTDRANALKKNIRAGPRGAGR